MNRQIGQLFALSMVLFAVLVGFTSQWSVFGAEALKDNTKNRRPLIEEQQIPRGLVRAADGRCWRAASAAARATSASTAAPIRPGRCSPTPWATRSSSKGRAGLERSRNGALTGEEDEFGTIFSQLQSQDREGKDVTTTLDPEGQRGGAAGAGGPQGLDRGHRAADGPRARDGQHPRVRPQRRPGAVRRVQPLQGRAAAQPRHPVAATRPARRSRWSPPRPRWTAASTPRSRWSTARRRVTSAACRWPTPAARTSARSALTDALTNSVNTVWAQVGESIGRGTLEEYMGRFGFNQDPRAGLPRRPDERPAACAATRASC